MRLRVIAWRRLHHSAAAVLWNIGKSFKSLKIRAQKFDCIAAAMRVLQTESPIAGSGAALPDELGHLVARIHKGGIVYSEAVRVFKKTFIAVALRENKGNLSRTAAVLGMHRNTLTHAMRDLGVEKAPTRPPRRPQALP